MKRKRCKKCGKLEQVENGYFIDEKFYCSECATECSECGEPILIEYCDETNEKKYVCPDCKERYYDDCHDCGVLVRVNHLHPIENEYFSVCDDCLSSYTMCSDCRRYYSPSNIRTLYDGTTLCRSCTANTYHYQCSDCGLYFPPNSNSRNNTDGNMYCPNCRNKHPDPIFNYHGFEDFKKIKKKDEPETNEYFGFELEVSGDRTKSIDFLKLVPHVVCMNDSSIEGGGFEIVSQPMSRKYFKDTFRKYLAKGLAYLRKNGFKGHNKGGLHIHVSADALSKYQLAQMAEILYGNDDDRDTWLCLTQRKEENIEHWSSMKNRYHTFADIRNSEDEMPLVGSGKYTALNRDTRTKTYEFRIFNSNLKIKRIMKNMECVFAIIDYTKHFENGLFKCDTRGFLNYVKWHKTEYPNLYKYILERKIEEHYGIKYTDEELEAA